MIRRTKLTFEAQRWKAEEALAREGVSIMVCAGTGCIAGGSLEVYEELRRICAEKGLAVSVNFSEHADDAIHLKKVRDWHAGSYETMPIKVAEGVVKRAGSIVKKAVSK